MSENWFMDILNMHKKFGINEKIENMDPATLRKFLKFRVECIQEEVDELYDAVAWNDQEEIVDALIDICVFAIGTLEAFQIDGLSAWNEVHSANMKKEVGIKNERPNPYGLPDLVKPQGWKNPNHRFNHGLLAKVSKYD